jgi:hypothetical protein
MTDIPGRGMIRVQAMDDGTILMEHAETGDQFEFAREDLDEVIGSLSMFRMLLECAEHDESNGEV